MSEKPIGVMPLCIIAIFLGIMGVFGGAMGLLGLLLNQQPSAPDPNPKLAELNAEFEKRIRDLTEESKPVTKVVSVAVIVTSVLLAAAGIAGTKLQGLGLLQVALASNLLVDAVAAYFGIAVQLKSASIMGWYFTETARLSNLPAGLATGMRFGMYTGVFFGLAWLLLKAVYYVWGLAYFGKKSVREAFAGRDSALSP